MTESKKQFTARKKVLKDLAGQVDESKRMRRDHKTVEWKIRSFVVQVEYWIVAFSLPVSIFIGMLFQDFWKGLAFWLATTVYVLSANIRGMTLHVENLVEWHIKKTI